MSDKISIRPYRLEDRFSVREIAWATAFKGESAQAFFEDKEFLADFLTLYFTDYEPGSCFVAECGPRVVGYILGATDERRLNSVFRIRIIWSLLAQALRRGVFFSGRNLRFFGGCVMSFLKGEFIGPDFSKDYPAVLHINVSSGLRGSGTGARLMSAYLEYLKKEGVRGVHLATASDDSRRFFEKQGFILLHQARRSYFRYLLGKDIPVYILGRKIV